ncbi:hypothetical protein BGZ58_000654, partial [Dissophora ornata]
EQSILSRVPPRVTYVLPEGKVLSTATTAVESRMKELSAPLENILVRDYRDGAQARFIDFAGSKRTSDQHELEKEIIKLKILLGLLGK